MDFDFSHIAVPFRMQPGLTRLAPGTPQLTSLAPASALWQEKQLVLQAGRSRHCLAGFDPAPAIESIAQHAQLTGASGTFDSELPLELAFEQDFAVLDGATGALPWLCVCVPSSWAPEEKLGLDFMALHAPVADNAALLAASKQLVQLVTAGDCWERHVWTISPSPRHDQHPHRHPRAPWPATQDPQAFADQCFLRAERQTFFPVGRGTRQAVFTIRVMLEPLVHAVDTPYKAQRLHDSLASMSDAVLAYKNLAATQPLLLRWLRTRMP
ncbi:heme-dependent oxidative N-demethylase subunit alpha family protein [uncultured Ramlibacter sp.]|uniref:heme-dependent oxidative N-demethylase subunit alpha family protein n=1 Tax=uncultured Ramlibacter sp. TaxID=260755 RepID=UPI002635D42C|nr:heme-dependent oxidative N-demethylase subunit alpha family protein [uncultured Ramlibacter sp.]